MSLNLPNQITVARLVMAIVFFVLLGQYSQRDPTPWLLDVSAAIFIIAAISDFIDGYIARKYNMMTPLGRVLDPLVDKVLVCGAFILFVGPAFVDENGVNATGMSAWMVVVIVSRELLVTGLRGFNESQGQSFGASVYGKIKMWTQSIAAPALLLIVAHEGTLIPPATASYLKTGLIYITLVATVLSTVQYLARSRHILDASSSS